MNTFFIYNQSMIRGLIISLSLIMFVIADVPANANCFINAKNKVKTGIQLRTDKKAIKKIIKIQDKYAQNYDDISLSKLYADDFISSDGFKKDVYFDLIKETWQAYPDISYTTEIKGINVEKDQASVDVYETSLATTTQVEENVAIYGELHSYSNGTYYLKKTNNKWLITSEKIKNEKSMLKYGDLRYVDIDLNSPETVKAGEYYTAALTVNTPESAMIVASIGRDNITYPQEKSEEIFRKMPEDNILERMFLANKEGKNEYNVASVAMTKTQVRNGKLSLYMAGIAFIMTRVNVEVNDEK